MVEKSTKQIPVQFESMAERGATKKPLTSENPAKKNFSLGFIFFFFRTGIERE
jgi:hypothetical protein